MDWYTFYEKRVNSNEYLDHFMHKYGYFLTYIDSEINKNIYKHIIYIGAGIGTAYKAHRIRNATTNKPKWLFIEKDMEMIKLLQKNIHSFPLKYRNEHVYKLDALLIAKNNIKFKDSLCITFGLLEHFSDEDIHKLMSIMPNSVHYVPLGGLKGYKTPSFGDERLLNFSKWHDLLITDKGTMPAHRIIDHKDLFFKYRGYE